MVIFDTKLDEFELYSGGNKIFINETKISNKYDREFNFARGADYLTTQWVDVFNEHFIVWMKMDSFSTIRKLWGKIDTKLFAGKYTIVAKAGI
jgi:hypothetical protein